MDNIERLPIQRFLCNEKINTDVSLLKEIPLTIVLNNEELVTLLCSPSDLRYLAIGFLSSEGFIKNKSEIETVTIDERTGIVRVTTSGESKSERGQIFKRLITSGCGRGASFYSSADIDTKKVESQVKINASELLALARKFQTYSELYLSTHGSHGSALCNNNNILVFNEDVGRHNAIDKVFGECLLKGIPTKDRIIITSGRVSSEIIHKIAKKSVPIIISKSVPTSLGVRLSTDLGITVAGFVRGKRMNLYSHYSRVIAAPSE